MGTPGDPKGGHSDYNGVRFTYCCGGCKEGFEKDPGSAVQKAVKGKKTFGVFMFDPVTRMPLMVENAKGGFSDFQGIRFYFTNPDGKKAFDANPKKYGTLPKKEAMYCPLLKEKVASYEVSGGYQDFEGVRYYFCCPECAPEFDKDPKTLSGNVSKYVGTPKVANSNSKG